MNNDNRFIIIDDDDMEDIVDLNMLPPQSSSSSSRSTQNNNSNNNSEPIEISDEEEDIICLSKQPTNQGSCFTFIHSPEPGQQRSPQQPSSDVGYYNHSWNFASIGGSSSTNYHETHEDADGYDSDCQIVENPNTAAAKMASTSSLTPSSSSSSSTALRTTAATLSTSAASSRRLGKQMARNRSPTPSPHTSSNSSSGSTTNKPSSSSQRGPVLNPPLMINSTPRPQEQEQQPNQQVEDRSPVSFSLFHTAEGFDESEDIDLGSNIRFEKEEEDLAARSTAAASPTLHEPAEATTILPPQDNNNTMGQPGSLERNNNKQQHYEPKPVEPPPPLPRLDCAACLASKPQFRVAEIEVYGFPLDARTADQLNTFERNLNIDNAKPAMTPEDIAADMFILDSAGVHTTSIEYEEEQKKRQQLKEQQQQQRQRQRQRKQQQRQHHRQQCHPMGRNKHPDPRHYRPDHLPEPHRGGTTRQPHLCYYTKHTKHPACDCGAAGRSLQDWRGPLRKLLPQMPQGNLQEHTRYRRMRAVSRWLLRSGDGHGGLPPVRRRKIRRDRGRIRVPSVHRELCLHCG
eukprot:GEZU01025845.1.p1 GENE.GEZU01025845.1~~GEZU01025845.1.p1  ORF type:complete len:587 (+),score=98.21 GEZU01025845.1:47-1762(+)